MISRSWSASNISLYPNYKIVGRLNPPIASFQIRVLDTIGKQSQILAMSGDLITLVSKHLQNLNVNFFLLILIFF
jgi:hypothetical protein